jgi:hypothetical protein
MERPTCPGCGAPLDPIVLIGPQPPWACNKNCQRAWWTAELRHRADYDPLQRSFGRKWREVQRESEIEGLTASIRGCSFTVEMVALIPQQALDAIASKLPAQSAVRDAITAKKNQGQGMR